MDSLSSRFEWEFIIPSRNSLLGFAVSLSYSCCCSKLLNSATGIFLNDPSEIRDGNDNMLKSVSNIAV